MISILIPDENNYFKTYAEGVFLHRQIFADQVEITLDDNYCFSLYYTFPHHSRVYICCSTSICEANTLEIYNVNKKFSVIAKIEGRRSFDRYKNAMDYLNKITKGEVYKLPVQFYWQLCYICQRGLNSNRNLELLCKKYKYDITYEKELLCSQKNTLEH